MWGSWSTKRFKSVFGKINIELNGVRKIAEINNIASLPAFPTVCGCYV